MRSMLRLAIAALALASCSNGPAGGYWPQWRGPKRDNVSTETGLLKEWPPEGPPLAWEVEGIGTGISGIVVAGGRIFAMGFFDDLEYLTALDESTGERLWVAPLGSTRGVPTSPTMRWLMQRAPTVDGDRVYAFSGDGQLVCLDVREGREIWRRSHVEHLAGTRNPWGCCDYPLVDGDRVLTVVDGPSPTLVALDKATGEIVWRSSTPQKEVQSGWSGEWAAIVVSEGGGVRQYVANLRHGTFGFRARDGKFLWSYLKASQGPFAHQRTPLVLADSVITLNGTQGGLARLRFVSGSDGVDVEEVYCLKQAAQRFTQDSALVVDGHLFSLDLSNRLVCYDAATGTLRWRANLANRRAASFVFAEGHLIVHGSDGSVAWVAVSPEKMEERGHFKTTERRDGSGATVPVVAGGRLYLREESRLFVFHLLEGVPAGPASCPIVLPEPARPPAPGPAIPRQAEFVPTPQDIVEKMLGMAKVAKDDVVYDLGSGDGRIVFTASRNHGCKSVGYEINPGLVWESRNKIRQSKLEELATIEEKDLFTVDLSPASVITLYLGEPNNAKLLPQLRKLKPGTRIVSHQHLLGPTGPKPDQTLKIASKEDHEEHTIHLWTAPLEEGK